MSLNLLHVARLATVFILQFDGMVGKKIVFQDV